MWTVGIEPGGAEFFGPAIPRLLVELGRVALGFVGLINRGVQALLAEISKLR